MEVDQLAPGWAQAMQRMMISVAGKVDVVVTGVEAARNMAREAKDEAMEAKVAATALEVEVETMKKDINGLKGEGFKKAVQ